MEEDEIYNIPVNYNESGKILGGTVPFRNFIESVIIVGIIGFLEFNFITSEVIKAIIMTVTLAPVTVFSFAGIDGDSLFQYCLRIVKFLYRKRILHLKRMDKDD